MSKENSATIETYEKDFDKYMSALDESPHQTDWIADGLVGVEKQAKIFEVGSGSGRDALFVESLGYTVQRSDIAESFIRHLRSNGYDALKLDLLRDQFPDPPYEIIIADAVLLHFTRSEFRSSLLKISDVLTDSGKFIFCLQNGQGDEWKENNGGPRYLCYWDKDGVEAELSKAGLVLDSHSVTDDDKWLHFVAKKVVRHES